MSSLVTDLPLWADCPFSDKLPEWCEVRCGTPEGYEGEQLVLRDAKLELFIQVDIVNASCWRECLAALTRARSHKLIH